VLCSGTMQVINSLMPGRPHAMHPAENGWAQD